MQKFIPATLDKAKVARKVCVCVCVCIHAYTCMYIWICAQHTYIYISCIHTHWGADVWEFHQMIDDSGYDIRLEIDGCVT